MRRPTGRPRRDDQRRRADRDRRHRPAVAGDAGARRGAATRRAAGTASRRRRSAARQRRGSSRPRKPTSRTRRRRSTSRRSSSGWTRTRSKEKELADFYFARFRAEFKPAVDAWVATRPLQNADAPLTPFAMPQYRVAAQAEARAARGRGGGAVGDGPAERPARDELRPLRRPVRGGALLRRHQHEAADAGAATRSCSASGSSCSWGRSSWLATFPVSISV